SDKADFISFDWDGVRLSVSVHDRVDGTSRDPLRLMVNLAVGDIGAVHERLVHAGVVFTRAPEREDWGGWVATFADPDGNVLQLMQLPCRHAPIRASLRVARARPHPRRGLARRRDRRAAAPARRGPRLGPRARLCLLVGAATHP